MRLKSAATLLASLLLAGSAPASELSDEDILERIEALEAEKESIEDELNDLRKQLSAVTFDDGLVSFYYKNNTDISIIRRKMRTVTKYFFIFEGNELDYTVLDYSTDENIDKCLEFLTKDSVALGDDIFEKNGIKRKYAKAGNGYIVSYSFPDPPQDWFSDILSSLKMNPDREAYEKIPDGRLLITDLELDGYDIKRLRNVMATVEDCLVGNISFDSAHKRISELEELFDQDVAYDLNIHRLSTSISSKDIDSMKDFMDTANIYLKRED